MRLIDADALQGLFNEVSTSLLNKRELSADVAHKVRAFLMTTEMIQDAPTVDAVPVVRCKDCKHFRPCEEIEGESWTGWCAYGDFHADDLDFCSRGERKTDEQQI